MLGSITFSSMLLALDHYPDFMAHDVSASRNLDAELPLGISPPGMFSALDRFNLWHRTHRADVLIAFCVKNCCSPMLIVKISSHCLHRDAISAGKFCWFVSGKEPVLMATRVLLRIVHPSLATSGRVLAFRFKDNSQQICVPFNPVLFVASLLLLLF